MQSNFTHLELVDYTLAQAQQVREIWQVDYQGMVRGAYTDAMQRRKHWNRLHVKMFSNPD